MGSSHSHNHDDESVIMDDPQKEAFQSQYNLTPTQMKDIDEQFKALAKNGGITRNKFIGAFTGAGVGAEFAGILFDSFDVDGNKKMTENEWYALMGVRLGGSNEDRLRASFGLFDKNHDGSLTRSELQELISLVQFHKQYYEFLVGGRILTNAGKLRLRKKVDKAAEDFINEMFSKADEDHSNTIDMEEFVSVFVKDSGTMAALNLFAQSK
jgi:Ca2+-binding EF-hand superfamily protein